MKTSRWNPFLAVLAAFVFNPLSSCSDQTTGGAFSNQQLTSPTGTGCIQGVAIDGITGNRVSLTPSSQNSGINVILRNSLIGAELMSSDQSLTGKTPNLVGEFSMCNIPLGLTLPLVAWVPGYQPFEGQVTVNNSGIVPPTTVANLRLYPTSTTTKSLSFTVTHAGAKVPNATVILKPAATNFNDTSIVDANFIAPRVLRGTALSGVTNAAGQAVFPATSLVLGQIYNYWIVPPNGGATLVTAPAASTFQLGLRSASSTSDPYEMIVDLNDTITSTAPLSLASTTLSETSLNSSGQATFTFNRPIEIVPGTAGAAKATLNNAVVAQLVSPIDPSSTTSQTVDIVVSGSTLTLSPKFVTMPDPTKDKFISVTYSNIFVRPKTDPGTGVAVDLSTLTALPLTVFLFSSTPTARVYTMSKISGDNQTGTTGAALPQTLDVKIVDQFGVPSQGATVVYSAAAGTPLSWTDPSGTSSVSNVASATTKTGADGIVHVTLAPVNGANTITVTSAGLTPVTFHATGN